MLSSPRNFALLSSAMLTIFIIIIVLLLTVAWFFMIQLPDPVGVISDDKMIAIFTGLYVVLTYKLIRSNSEIVQQQRMPYLEVNMDRTFKYKIKNTSNYAAKDIQVELEMVYPISANPFYLWLRRFLPTKLYGSKFYKNKLNYMSLWLLERLEANTIIYVNINDKALQFLPLKISMLDDSQYLSDKENRFDVIVKCVYSSSDNLQVTDYRRFEFKSDQTGTDLLNESGLPVEICED